MSLDSFEYDGTEIRLTSCSCNGTLIHLKNVFYQLPVREKLEASPLERAKLVRHLKLCVLKHSTVNFDISCHGLKIHIKVYATDNMRQRIAKVQNMSMQNLVEVVLENGGFAISLQNPSSRALRLFFLGDQSVSLDQFWNALPSNIKQKLKKKNLIYGREKHFSGLSQLKSPEVNTRIKERPAIDLRSNVISSDSHSITTARICPGEQLVNKCESLPMREACLDLRDTEFVGIFNCEFLVLKRKDDGLILIDQHAAHERIRLEKLCLSLRPDCTKASRDIPPVSDKRLQSIGFDEQEIPKIFEAMSKEDVQDGIHEMLCPDFVAPIGPTFMDHLKTMACKGAIRFGDVLPWAKMQQLIGDLSRCSYPGICAHGRPSYIILRMSDKY